MRTPTDASNPSERSIGSAQRPDGRVVECAYCGERDQELLQEQPRSLVICYDCDEYEDPYIDDDLDPYESLSAVEQHEIDAQDAFQTRYEAWRAEH